MLIREWDVIPQQNVGRLVTSMKRRREAATVSFTCYWASCFEKVYGCQQVFGVQAFKEESDLSLQLIPQTCLLLTNVAAFVNEKNIRFYLK